MSKYTWNRGRICIWISRGWRSNRIGGCGIACSRLLWRGIRGLIVLGRSLCILRCRGVLGLGGERLELWGIFVGFCWVFEGLGRLFGRLVGGCSRVGWFFCLCFGLSLSLRRGRCGGCWRTSWWKWAGFTCNIAFLWLICRIGWILFVLIRFWS